MNLEALLRIDSVRLMRPWTGATIPDLHIEEQGEPLTECATSPCVGYFSTAFSSQNL
jgi:hypothetical protein